jgi:hypothetical protein
MQLHLREFHYPMRGIEAVAEPPICKFCSAMFLDLETFDILGLPRVWSIAHPKPSNNRPRRVVNSGSIMLRMG